MGQISPLPVQAKLTANRPGDNYEQEADRVAAEGTKTQTPGVAFDFSKIRISAPAIPIQPKLTVNQPGDKYEQEADRIAEEVMRVPDFFAGGISLGGPPNVQKKCAACESGAGLCPECAKEEETKLQRKTIALNISPLVQRESAKPGDDKDEEEEFLQTKNFSGQNTFLTPDLNTRVHALTSTGGIPLPETERAFFEPRFGFDFGPVRVFNDSSAADLTQDLNARAFTIGNNIAFGAGQYAPETGEGRRLMAHELTHAVQQGGVIDGTNSFLQRQSTETSTNATTEEPVADTTVSDETATQTLIVEDEARELATGQMRKSEFLTEVRNQVCGAVEEILSSTGHTSHCLDFVNMNSSRKAKDIERTLRQSVPETSDISTARDYIPIITILIRQNVETWLRTGQISRLTESVPSISPPEASSLSSEGNTTLSEGLLFKNKIGGPRGESTPQAIQAQLGKGQPLNSGVRSNMSSAFGYDFSHVRIHTDSAAEGLSNRFNARAFTLGQDIAFGAGEYQPGTLIGDALIAHELAHVMQQEESGNPGVLSKDIGDGSYNELESEADLSAVSAMIFLMGNKKGILGKFTTNVLPRLKSGLRLQACNGTVKRCPPGKFWEVVATQGAGPVCTCSWKCRPGGGSMGYSSGPSIGCDPRSYCPQPDYEDVSDNYEIKNPGTVISHGAHMTPLGGQAICGCSPLDIEDGTQTGAPLRKVDFQITDLAGMSGRPPRDPRTGVISPSSPTPAPPKRPPPTIARPPTHPGVTSAPPTRPATTPAEPTRTPGQGISYAGKIQWGNPSSRPAYGHSQSEHGRKRPAEELRDRARTTNNPQGQFYDDNTIVQAEQRAPLTPGAHDVPMGRAVGRVHMPDGTVVENVTTVRVVRRDDLRVDTSFPIN